MIAGELAHLAREMHGAIGQQDFGFADAARIKNDLARRGIAGVVLIGDAEIEIAERHPDTLAAPAHMNGLALERHRLAKRRHGFGRQLLLEAGLEGEFTGTDNQLAHRSLLLDVGEDVVSAVSITAGTSGSKADSASLAGFNESTGAGNLPFAGPQLWVRTGPGRDGTSPPGRDGASPRSKEPPKAASEGETMARSRGNDSGISSRMKASSFSLISQRRSQDCGAVLALTSARSSIARGLASITWRLTTAPSHNLDSRTACSSRCLIRETSVQ